MRKILFSSLVACGLALSAPAHAFSILSLFTTDRIGLSASVEQQSYDAFSFQGDERLLSAIAGDYQLFKPTEAHPKIPYVYLTVRGEQAADSKVKPQITWGLKLTLKPIEGAFK